MSHAPADLAHDLFTSGEDGNRITVGNSLRKRAQVGVDPVQLLHSPASNPKAGFDLVNDQHDSMLVAQRARSTQVLRVSGNPEAVAHNGLYQQTRDLVSAACHNVFQLFGIVRLHEMRKAARADGNALAVWIDFRVTDLSPFIHGGVPHGGIEKPVIAAFENDVVILS